MISNRRSLSGALGRIISPFGPSSQAPTFFRFALVEPKEVLTSVAKTKIFYKAIYILN
jgi:hypothetical protein